MKSCVYVFFLYVFEDTDFTCNHLRMPFVSDSQEPLRP